MRCVRDARDGNFWCQGGEATSACWSMAGKLAALAVATLSIINYIVALPAFFCRSAAYTFRVPSRILSELIHNNEEITRIQTQPW